MRVLTLAAMLVIAGAGMSGQEVTPTLIRVDGIGAVAGGLLGGVGMGGVVRGQPYSLVAKTATVRLLADGTTITNVQEEHRMRDSEGRQRTEIGRVVDGKVRIDMVMLVDPVAKTTTNLFERNKEARVNHFPEPKSPTPEMEARMAEMRAKAAAARAKAAQDGAASGGDAPKRQNANVEKLTPKNIAGLYAEGQRTVMVIPAGRVGNDREMKVVTEYWRSPDLGIELESMRDDPQSGKSTMEVTQLDRAEPDAALFKVPEGYKVIDQKQQGSGLLQ